LATVGQLATTAARATENVPRWSGDTNFMGVLAGVEVIPQALDTLWQLLAEQDGAQRGQV